MQQFKQAVPLGVCAVSRGLPGTCSCAIPRKNPGNNVGASVGARAAGQTHLLVLLLRLLSDYSDLASWLAWWAGALGYLHRLTEHNSYVRCPGIFQETSRKHPGGPGVGAPGDEDVCTGRAREGAHDAGGLAAGWYYLARSLTAASIATAPSGLEFETRDGSHSGAVATGRQGLDRAWTVWLCSLPEVPCALLLLFALPA